MTPAPKTSAHGKVVLKKVASKGEALPPKKAPPVITKSDRIRAALAKGLSVKDAAKQTQTDPAFAWDVAKAWSLKTGNQVPGMRIGWNAPDAKQARDAAAPKLPANAPARPKKDQISNAAAKASADHMLGKVNGNGATPKVVSPKAAERAAKIAAPFVSPALKQKAEAIRHPLPTTKQEFVDQVRAILT